MALDTSSIDPLFQQAQQATDQATSLAASGANLPQQLREAVTGRLESSPLFGQREKAAEQVLTSGSRAREDISGILKKGQAGEAGGAILSPTQQQSIISARGAADVVPLTSLNDLLTARIGGVDTAVNAGLNAYQTMLQNAQNLATTKTGQAESAFNRLLQLAADKRAEEELGLKKAEVGKGNASFDNILKVFNAMKPTAGQENTAVSAKSGLNATNYIETLLKSNSKAKNWGTSGILGTLGKVIGGKDVQLYQQNAREAYDAFLRTRTGAALNLNEQAFYEQYVPSRFDTDSAATDKINRLKSIFNDEINLSENPTLDFLQQSLLQGLVGGGDWEIIP